MHRWQTQSARCDRHPGSRRCNDVTARDFDDDDEIEDEDRDWQTYLRSRPGSDAALAALRVLVAR